MYLLDFDISTLSRTITETGTVECTVPITIRDKNVIVCVLQVMEEAIQRLEKRHKEHIILYDSSGVSGGERGRGP
jgi:hypothetical protein